VLKSQHIAPRDAYDQDALLVLAQAQS